MPQTPDRVPVRGSLKERAPGAREIAAPVGPERFTVTVRVRRRRELPSEHQAVAASIHARQYMSRDDFERTHGADPADLAKVEEFARRHNLKVEESSVPRRSVFLSGTAADFSRAFGVELKHYERDGKTYRGREGHIFVPPELSEIVEGVFGLDNRPFARPHYRVAPLPARREAAAAGPELSNFSPAQVGMLYNFPAGLNGTGQTIGILELGGGFHPQELDTYFRKLGISPPAVSVASFTGGGSNNPGPDPLDPNNSDIEVDLDVEVAGAVAPGARIVVYFAPDASDQSFLDGLTAAIHDPDNKVTVISISWGGPEATASEQFQTSFDQTLQTAKLLGITVCVAAGDNGSADYAGDDSTWDGGAHVDFPASSPFALACGGTRLLATASAIDGEVVWHPGANEGTGGGVSRFFALPDYQGSVTVPRAVNPDGPVMRGVPDVAGDAAQESGYQVLCDGLQFPDPAHNPPLPPIGGTSAVAPLWAGLIACLNQGLGKNLGLVQPLLYNLPTASGAFRDITEGNNGDYAAGPGWDACTGLGSPNGQALLNALKNASS